MITVYFDMDDVITDFNGFYGGVDFDKTRFEIMVEDSLFTKLKEKPRARELFDYVDNTLLTSGHHYNIEFLSSLGSPNSAHIQRLARSQKLQWLETHGYGNYHANFVVHKGLKKRFATPHSILIDDTQQNVWDFNENLGYGILYTDDIDKVVIEFHKALTEIGISHNTNIITE